MEASELSLAAELLVELYKEFLLIDPFYSIEISVTKGDFISCCEEGSGALSWIIKLNPDRHNAVEDVQYSVIEALLRVMFSGMDDVIDSNSKTEKVKNGIISRLSSSLCDLLPVEFEEQDDEE